MEVLTLLGSYAYGAPDESSDIDLLVVKPIKENVLQDALAIRRAFRPLAQTGAALAFDLLVESPERDRERLAKGGAFYEDINNDGVNLLREAPMLTDETNPADCYMMAADKLRAADAVFAALGPSHSCVVMLHEATERYLKGWLIGKGWRLARTHDLYQLVDAAQAIEPQFHPFADFAADLTQQYFLQHYPGGDLSSVGQNYDDLRIQAGVLVAIVTASLP